MKNTIIALVAALAIVGCKENNKMNEPSGAQKENIKQSEKAQKDTLEQQKKDIQKSASATKKQISDSASAEKERVEAQAEAAKADITAQEKKVEAEAKAAKADAEAQAKAAKAENKISESAGAQASATATGLAAGDQATSDSDRAIVQQIRQSFSSGTAQPQSTASMITISSADGAVTLKGTVASDAEKADLESKAKAVSGVKSVDNQLKVQ